MHITSGALLTFPFWKPLEPLALFIADEVNYASTEPLFRHLADQSSSLKYLIRTRAAPSYTGPELTYEAVLARGSSVTASELQKVESSVQKDDVVNIQFTSGTTGSPKAAMLTHL